MPKSGDYARPVSGPTRKQNAHRLREDSGDQRQDDFARDMNRQIRDTNVRIMDTARDTRRVMANAGPGAKRKRVNTVTMLSQRKPGGSD